MSRLQPETADVVRTGETLTTRLQKPAFVHINAGCEFPRRGSIIQQLKDMVMLTRSRAAADKVVEHSRSMFISLSLLLHLDDRSDFRFRFKVNENRFLNLLNACDHGCSLLKFRADFKHRSAFQKTRHICKIMFASTDTILVHDSLI